jgi:hypothetical protein
MLKLTPQKLLQEEFLMLSLDLDGTWSSRITKATGTTIINEDPLLKKELLK